jgi:DNA-binding XRE family transcriptional regulator
MARIKRARKGNAPLSAIPNGILELRLSRNLMQQEVADGLGIPRGTYSTVEAGYCIPSRDLADKLCKFFECQLGDLYPEEVLGFIS